MEDFRTLNRYGLLDSAEVNVNGTRHEVSEITRRRIWQTHGQQIDSDLWAFCVRAGTVRFGPNTAVFSPSCR